MVSKDKKSQPDEIEDWDEIEEVDLSKKRYISDETRAIHSKTTKEKWAKRIYDSQRLNNEILIERFREVHGDKYDYSKIDYDYKQRDKHLIIICPVHGEFTKQYKAHIKGYDCLECRKDKERLTKQTKLLSDFKKVHGDR